MRFQFSLSRSWVSVALVTLVAVLVPEGFSQEDKPAVDPAATPSHIEGMVKISPKRHVLDPGMIRLCAAPSSILRGPHNNAAVLVYANQKVVDYRNARVIDENKAAAEGAELPVGSVLVKEKYADLKAEQPHLATIMRRTGSKGGIEDWDFSVVSLPDGKPAAMTANDKAACAECHSNFAKRGFVSQYSFDLLKQISTGAAGGESGQVASNKPLSVLPATHLVGLEKLSHTRHSLPSYISKLCINLTAGSHGPHEKSAILVYANDKVLDYRKAEIEGAELPVGSILLKEKYADLKVEKPHLATIMRRTGDEGGVEDWDFSVISLPDGKPAAMTATDKAACADCHDNFAQRGFISNYTDHLLLSVGLEAQKQASGSRPNVDSKGFIELAIRAEKLREKRILSAEDFVRFTRKADTIVLDARSREAYARQHVAGAVSLPYTEFTPDALAQIIPTKKTTVIIYCDNNIEWGEGRRITWDDSGQNAAESGPKAKRISESAPETDQEPGKGGGDIKIGGDFKGANAALVIPTYITLVGYGFENVYELGPSERPGHSVIEFISEEKTPSPEEKRSTLEQP